MVREVLLNEVDTEVELDVEALEWAERGLRAIRWMPESLTHDARLTEDELLL
jgi:hypothetical protein